MMSRTWRLSGNVKVITDPKETADLYIKIVKRGGSIGVKIVKEITHECGEWRWVPKDSKIEPDFTVKFVTDDFYDFTVKFVGENEMAGSN
jgi:hypothetical protein